MKHGTPELWRRLGGPALGMFVVAGVMAAARPSPPPFKEVFDVIRENAAGVTSADLNQAAVEGLLKELHPRAWILDAKAVEAPETNMAALATGAVFDDSYGYVRVARAGAGLPEQFARAMTTLTSSNKLKGLVIDLRFANGQDYAAAGAVADQFLPSEQKLFQWAGGAAISHGKTNAFRAPVAVLVNQLTAGAPEALAAVLRDTEVALLIGTNTAGQASTTKDFPLSNGQVLRVATSPVTLAGGEALASLQPDITVEVGAEEERAYFADAYKMLPKQGAETNSGVASLSVTNKSPRRRMNEAELMRTFREGAEAEDDGARSARPGASARPVVADPALARAIDLLKALAVVRRGHL